MKADKRPKGWKDVSYETTLKQKVLFVLPLPATSSKKQAIRSFASDLLSTSPECCFHTSVNVKNQIYTF